MEKRIEKMTKDIQRTFGLNDYFLKTYHLSRRVNSLLQTNYYITMEWFPNQYAEWVEDTNPDGTAVIEVDFHTEDVNSIIFVNGVTYTTKEQVFPTPDLEHIIDWIEVMTGLTWGRQIQLHSQSLDKKEFHFQATVDNMPVWPTGTIDLEFNHHDQLVSFTKDGVFPSEEMLNWEPFSLIPEATAYITSANCKLMKVPGDTSWKYVYGIHDQFVTNDGKKHFPVDTVTRNGTFKKMDVLLEWQEKKTSDNLKINEQIQVERNISIEQAISHEPAPAVQQITEQDMDACIHEATHYLQAVAPSDTGRWRLCEVYRYDIYLIAILKQTNKDYDVAIEPRHTLFIKQDAELYHIVHVLDDKALWDNLYVNLKEPKAAVITKEQAFEKLQKHVTLTPTYVYDVEKQSYELCGKISCPYFVHAVTGELSLIDL